MKTAERDEILVRVSERTLNIWHVVEKLERHQEEQNGYIRENIIATTKNSSWRVTSRWIMGILFTVIFAVIGVIFGII